MSEARPTSSVKDLRRRVDRLFANHKSQESRDGQLEIDFPGGENRHIGGFPDSSVSEFLDFVADIAPASGVYLFGGLLRDVALYGKRGFNSDVDVVIDGDWQSVKNFLSKKGAQMNKFGGFRINVNGWPVDIWNAKETWAIKEGYVSFNGISSLIDTTILNWDGILMNWKEKNFIFREDYFDELKSLTLDIVLEKNPKPKGMAVRVFRHMCSKDARHVTVKAVKYIAEATKKYSFYDLKNSEISSYGESFIEPSMYSFFRKLSAEDSDNLRYSAKKVIEDMETQGWKLSSWQLRLQLEE